MSEDSLAMCMDAYERLSARLKAVEQERDNWNGVAHEMKAGRDMARAEAEQLRAKLRMAQASGLITGVIEVDSDATQALREAVAAALARVAELEGALLKYCRHGEYCELSQAVPAEDEDKFACSCGLAVALTGGKS